MASRSIDDCHPIVAAMLRECVAGWQAVGLDVLVTCTYRDGAEQDALFARGRTLPGAVVTNARAGQSAHNFTQHGRPASLAFDVVPLVNGKPEWSTKGPAGEAWRAVARVAKAAGLAWYGDPGQPFKEFPHFEHPNARALRTTPETLQA